MFHDFFVFFPFLNGPQHREITIIIFPKTGYCPNYSTFKPSKYWKYSILMTVPIRKSGFIKKWFFLFSLLSPDVLHYFWTKNHKNTSKCTLCPRLHPKSDFQFTKKKNTPGKRSLDTTFEFKLYFFIILPTFLMSFCEGLLYQSYRNHVLNDFEMLSLGQKTLKISKNT